LMAQGLCALPLLGSPGIIYAVTRRTFSAMLLSPFPFGYRVRYTPAR